MLLMACGAEDELPLDWAADGDQAPPVWFAVEEAEVLLSAGVYLVGEATIREGTARLRGRIGTGLTCAWGFDLRAIAVAPEPTQDTDWSFTIRYQPLIDHLLAQTGAPSRCSSTVFPNGPGAPFEVDVAHDAASDEMYRREGGVWRLLAPSAYQRSLPNADTSWLAALGQWP